MSAKAGIEAPVSRAGSEYERLERATEGIEAPFALVDLDAMWSNADEMLGRAAGKPIRVASKSIRCRALMERILARGPGYRGLLTYTLPESLWLAREGFEDLVVGYPTADRTAIGDLARLTDAQPGAAPVLMVDSVAHLDLIEDAAGDGSAADPRGDRARRRILAARGPAEDRAEAVADPHAAPGDRAGAGGGLTAPAAPGRPDGL